MVSGCGAGLLGLAKSFATSYYTYLLGELLETVLGASVYPCAFVLSKYSDCCTGDASSASAGESNAGGVWLQ